MGNAALKSVTKAIRQVEDVLQLLKRLRLDLKTDTVNDYALRGETWGRQTWTQTADCPHELKCSTRQQCWAGQIAVRDNIRYREAFQRVEQGEQP